MDHFAQAHLSELLSAARQGPPLEANARDEWQRRTLMCFQAAWAALQGVGAVSAEEASDWTNRMLVALGEEPLEPEPDIPGVHRARMISFGGKAPPRPPDPPPESKFLALVPANEPDRPMEYGGRIQILGIELYSDKVTVNWRLAPLPDYEAVFADELAQQEPDLEGLPPEYRKILRDKLTHQLQMRRRFVNLTDDAGTQYLSMGGGAGGGGNERRGHTDFRPAVPETARTLYAGWDDLQFEVSLPRGYSPAP